MDYKKTLAKYIEQHHKNLNQFCKEYDLNYGSMHSRLNGDRKLELVAAKNIEDKIFEKTGLRIFSAKDEEFEPGTFRIPEYNVKLSAGHGEEVISPENIIRHHILNDTFLVQYRVKPENLAVVSVTGHSMETTLRDGERVVIDISRRESIDNRVFAITTKNHCWVKRLRVTTNGERWRSDNEEYREFDDELNNGTTVVIDGLVLYSLGREIN